MNISTSDLSVEQRELLICLSEKALEIDRLIDDLLHPRLLPNGELSSNIHYEVGDFIAIVERLVDLDLLSGGRLDDRVDYKLAKLENYVLYKNDIDIADY